MSKNKKKVVAKAKADVKVADKKKAPKADVKSVAEKVAARQAELAKLPVKVPQEKAVKPDFLTVPDACDALNFKKGIYGAYNADDEYCKDCVKDFPETAKACIHNTKLMQQTTAAKKEKAKAASGTKKPKAPKEGVELDCFGRRVDSGAGRIDAMLLRKEGATMEEMQKERKAVGSHLSALKHEGYDITLKDGKYFAKAPAKK